MERGAVTPPNVVVVVLDTLRARNCSSYGHERATTPVIDRLAEEGVRFSRATTVSPWTLPSHASLFTGVPPTAHRTNSLESQLPESLSTVATTLARAGYDTVGMSMNPWLSSLFGVTRGFETFHNLQGPFATDTYRQFTMLATDETRSVPQRVAALVEEQSPGNLLRNCLTAAYRQVRSPDDDGAEQAISHAERVVRRSDQYFLFLNLLEPHLPYDPPPSVRRTFVPESVSDERLDGLNQDSKAYNVRNVEMDDEEFDLLERLYDAEIRYVDSQLASLLETIDEQGDRDETLLIVTSDHGENIGDHGLMGHNYSVHQTLLEVPLVARFPDYFEGGRVEDGRVSTLDVPATIADVLADYGVDTNEFGAQQRGRSLAEPVPMDRTVTAEYLNPVPSIDRLREACEDPSFDVSTYDRTMRTVLRANWKFVTRSDGTRDLYDLADDPGETTDVGDDSPDVRDSLSTVLREWTSALETAGEHRTGDVGESVEQRLEELGYR